MTKHKAIDNVSNELTISIGDKILKEDGSLYGYIVDEGITLFELSKSMDNSIIPDPINKNSLISLIVGGTFKLEKHVTAGIIEGV